ncbi:MAG: sensor histidine kinase [Candidatus Dormibacteria bacterium]
MRPQRSAARRHALRVAVMATAAVAAALTVLCASVDLVVQHNLHASAENKLNAAITQLHAEASHKPFTEPDFDDPLVGWQLDARRVVTTSSPGAPPLPATARTVTKPESIAINGTQFLVAGVDVSSGRIVVGESLTSVSRALQTIVIAEVSLGPVLLVVIFLGALIIGRRAARPIERAHQRQLEFTADASHELRTPLSVIEAEASLALSQPAKERTQTQALQRVLDESRRLRRMVDDMLWLARFDASPSPPPDETVDLATSAETSAQRFHPVAEQRGVTLDVQAGAPALVQAPPEWVDRLIGVLLDNAIRHAGCDGRVRVASARDGSQVRLAVADSGPGIPAEQRALIFDRFRRAANDGEGAGLGLAIGDAVVKATQGRWEIGESDLGGASVGVVWPLVSPRLHDGTEP